MNKHSVLNKLAAYFAQNNMQTYQSPVAPTTFTMNAVYPAPLDSGRSVDTGDSIISPQNSNMSASTPMAVSMYQGNTSGVGTGVQTAWNNASTRSRKVETKVQDNPPVNMEGHVQTVKGNSNWAKAYVPNTSAVPQEKWDKPLNGPAIGARRA